MARGIRKRWGIEVTNHVVTKWWCVGDRHHNDDDVDMLADSSQFDGTSPRSTPAKPKVEPRSAPSTVPRKRKTIGDQIQ